ncbi:hypothetical protein HYC85_029968 [Camellia sinensis]|uniref:BSD domain-containing protein n=1 Tax=Camellia sinensis TaxID=4442 RepID=A0A7J7G033_CAMSI|nr:hypothetical protein HYC85_029968 [Camellia sinensis]
MDFWQRARSFAEEAAKRSQELTIEAAKRSQDFTIGSSKLSEIVSEASKRADQIKVEALKRADQIKAQIPPAAALSSLVEASLETTAATEAAAEDEAADLEKFGVTDELREFVKSITMNTFRDFPLEDDSEMSDIPTVSNVRQDLTAWQERHAKLVLSTVKNALAARHMKAKGSHKYYSDLVIWIGTHETSKLRYERRYMEEARLKAAEQAKDDKKKEASTSGTTSETETGGINQKSKTSPTSEQDLDVFLLGDLGDSDDGPDDGDGGGFDDDFDKI